ALSNVQGGTCYDTALERVRSSASAVSCLTILVSCPRNSRYIAGGQLAVFQGASEAPISESCGSSEQRGKTANWPRPKGLRWKWAGGCVARRSRIGSDMLPPCA